MIGSSYCALFMIAVAIWVALLVNVTLASVTLEYVAQHLSEKVRYSTLHVPQKDHIIGKYKLHQFQLIKRHGTRYPLASEIDDISKLLDKLKLSTNGSLVRWTRDYRNRYIPALAGQLVDIGQLEHYTHGQRFAKSYPELLQQTIGQDGISLFTAHSSWSERTSQSGMAFVLGAFEGYGQLGSKRLRSVPFLSYPLHNDTLLHFHENCQRWSNVMLNTDFVSSSIKPYEAAYLQPIADRLTHDLGMNFTTQDTVMLYTACTSEASLYDTVDTFCSLLNGDDILLLEYYRDLKIYYLYSYGYEEVNGGIACDLAKSIIANIDAAVNNGTSAGPLHLSFGHIETLLALYTLFGWFKDPQALRWDTPPDQVNSRKFRPSLLGPYASNAGFQVLSVKDKKGTSEKKFYIRVLINEQELVVPGCDSAVCSYVQFRAAVAPSLKCNFDKVCKL